MEYDDFLLPTTRWMWSNGLDIAGSSKRRDSSLVEESKLCFQPLENMRDSEID